MSVPLHEADVETLDAYLTLHLGEAHDSHSLTLDQGVIRLRARVAPASLVEPLRQIGYRSKVTGTGLVIDGRTAYEVPPQYPVPENGTYQGGTKGGTFPGTSALTRANGRGTPHPVHQLRMRLHYLRQSVDMTDAELLEDPYTTDDGPIQRLRTRLRRSEHRTQLIAHARDEKQERRSEARELRLERRQERRDQALERNDRRARQRSDRAARRADRRTSRISRRAEQRRKQASARHVEWEHSTRLSGRQELLKRQMATTAERKAALLARMQAGILVTATLSIIGLGAASASAVHKAMVAHASASGPVAWGVEPAFILLLVGVTVARYLLSRTGGTFPTSVTVLEWVVLGTSTVLAGLGGGLGAVVTPLGVAVVVLVAAKLLKAAADAEPKSTAPIDPSRIDQLMYEVHDHLQSEGTPGTGNSEGTPGTRDLEGTPGTGNRTQAARDKIATAAQELIDEGRKVTPSGVRRITGMKLPTVRRHWEVAERVIAETVL